MATVADFSDRLVDEYAELDPIAGAELGVNINAAHLPDYSPRGYERFVAFVEGAQRELALASDADEAGRLGRCFLRYWLSATADMLALAEWKKDVSVIGGPPAMVRQSFDLAVPQGPDDWDAIARRMEAVPATMAGYRQSLELGVREGKVAPARSAKGVAEQCRRWSGAGGDGGWFSRFAAGAGEVPHSERLRRAATKADAAYGELAEWMVRDYLPSATGPEAAGSEAYQVWARYCLGTRLDLDEAYSWGWEELGRLKEEQAHLCAELLPGARFLEVRDFLVEDRGRLVVGEGNWRQWLQELTDSTIARLQGTAFDIPEALRTCRVGIPPEGTAAAPYYLKPSEDMSRPGSIWFPSMGRTSFPTWDAPTTVYHEAVPGHHLQLGTAQLAHLTRMHKLMAVSSHAEGWALYAERLMDEMGAFDRADYRLGFISMQAMRAARVVIDIGLHTGWRVPQGWGSAGQLWTYELAVDFLEEASGMPVTSPRAR